MDQLKAILQHVKKHHFWLLCVACLIAGLLGWRMAGGRLSAEYTKRKGEIEGKFAALQAILQTENFPNPRWKEQADKLTGDEKQRVKAAWQLVYNEQAQFLKWPDLLGEDFLKVISSRSQGSDLEPRYCELYMTQIPREFPKLLEIVGAEAYDAPRSTVPTTPASTAPSKQNSEVMNEEWVVWDNESQEKVHGQLKFEARPTSLQVWLTQEDLWVYQTLLTIIKKVNAGGYVPAVREINELLIAKPAAAEFEKGLAPGMIDKPAAGGPEAAPSSSPPAQAVAPAEEGEVPPDQGRYVDADGKPLPAGGAGAQPFKRMPIHMKLKIDQREIAKLLVECANSPLPVEVRQLRINPKAESRDNRGPTPAGSQSADGSATDHAGYDVPIELSGIIYIYNPPDASRLGGDAAAPTGDPTGTAQPAAPGG
jgi:hypothetical protein